MNDLMVRQIPADQRVLRDWNAPTKAEQRQASRTEILRELTVNNSWRSMARYTRTQILATRSDQTLELINVTKQKHDFYVIRSFSWATLS